jgi:two-component system, NarL family, response regulator NreC
MARDTIQVLLADDQAVVRAGLKAMLCSARDISVVGEASTGQEAVEMAHRLKPDVVIMDLTMPEMDGTAATRQIVENEADARVLVLTMHAEDDYLSPVMQAGASGYLMKADADRELVGAVRAVAHGDTRMRPTVTRAPASKAAAKDPLTADRQQYEKLTMRERDVLRLVGQGYSAPEIGAQLMISPKTVDTYKQRIQEKLHFTHRSHYIQFALKLGLLTPQPA